MNDLNQYIIDILPNEDEIISELNSSIDRTLDLFRSIPFDINVDAWGYKVLDDEAARHRGEANSERNFSQSTSSMIVASLIAKRGHLDFHASSGFPWKDYTNKPIRNNDLGVDEKLTNAANLLLKKWISSDNINKRLISTTYGHNDILSLSWHYDVFKSIECKLDEGQVDIIQEIISIVRDRAQNYIDADSSYLAICECFRDGSTPIFSDSRVGDSSYILLRFVRCLKAVNLELGNSDPIIHSAMIRASKRLQTKLHDQLSLAEITDSRFDPSELAFCLEGMMHLKSDLVDHKLLDRAVSVMSKAQEQNAYWRSETPIVIQQRGHVLFPIGVEAARSMLNTLALFAMSRKLQGKKQDIKYDHLTVLRRYWNWLKSRQVAIKRDAKILHGWHSEHINDPDLVHTWETSQILEFMIGFKVVLEKYVADELLILSRLEVRQPKQPISWNDVVYRFEPCREAPYDTYSQIGADFVSDRQSNSSLRPKNWSMLLYGPPGTGKSTIAENLGDCLKVPVITVTVSDFLGEGESRMESRVKNIFTVIERQAGAVVLFDEMDQFLLDRNSDLFREQDSVFQFLTPGMLTKFAKLRKSESVIFIIATNYEERIDPAIKRSGRIDQRYLVLPPDNARRLQIFYDDLLILSFMMENSEKETKKLIESSCLLAYTDIKNVIAKHPKDFNHLISLLSGATRNIQFSSIASRYAESPSKGLDSEIEGILMLINEAQLTQMDAEGDWEGSKDFIKFMTQLPPECKPREKYNYLNKQKRQTSS